MSDEKKVMNPLRKLEQEVSVAKNVKDILKISLLSDRYIANYQAVSGRKDGRERFEREAFAFIDLVNSKPEIMECDPFSIMAGFIKASTTGCSFTDGKLSVYPRGVKQKDGSFKKMLVVSPDAHGKREMLERMPTIKEIVEGVVVYNKDKFVYDAKNKKVITHEQEFPSPAPSEETVKGAYCTVMFTDGTSKEVVLTLHELKAARSKSPNVSYIEKDGQNVKVRDGGELWNKFYGEACKKSTYNRAFKIYHKLPETAMTFPQWEAPEEEATQDVNYTPVAEDTFLSNEAPAPQAVAEEPVVNPVPEPKKAPVKAQKKEEAKPIEVQEVKTEEVKETKKESDSFLD